MVRPLTRAQQLQNAAFLRALRRTGNVRLAARTAGIKYGTVQYRRARHPDFARRWDIALTFALARLNAGERRGPVAAGGAKGALRTTGGEPVIVRRNDGKLQMRAAQPAKLTKQCEQTFLASLSASANVRLSAAAAGASGAAFYRRRRRNIAFAREWRLALQQGYERLELALLESTLPTSFEDDHWRHNEPPAIPPMTANQALQLMYLHQKEARLGGTPAPLRRRPGESRDAQSMRLALLYEAQREQEREKFKVAEAMRLARGEPTYIDWEAEGVTLPDLSQVTGWSRADPAKAATDDSQALFGGWRLRDIPADQRKR